MKNTKKIVQIKNLEVGYDDVTVLKNVNFFVNQGEIVAILGGSGSGKSTILKHMIGLNKPMNGEIIINGINIAELDDEDMAKCSRHFGVLYQSGALFSSMTLIENISLPIKEFTKLPESYIKSYARAKLGMVGLTGFEHYYPHEISGGMKKRAGIARALALDPQVLFLDEPSAGLDPITSMELDDLILDLKSKFGTTIIVVTHELESIFTIADRIVVLDKESKTVVADGNPEELKKSSNSWIRKFLNRSRH